MKGDTINSNLQIPFNKSSGRCLLTLRARVYLCLPACKSLLRPELRFCDFSEQLCYKPCFVVRAVCRIAKNLQHLKLFQPERQQNALNNQVERSRLGLLVPFTDYKSLSKLFITCGWVSSSTKRECKSPDLIDLIRILSHSAKNLGDYQSSCLEKFNYEQGKFVGSNLDLFQRGQKGWNWRSGDRSRA